MRRTRFHGGTSVPRAHRRSTDGLTRSARAISIMRRPWIERTAARYAGTVSEDAPLAGRPVRTSPTSAPRGARRPRLHAPKPTTALLDQRIRPGEQTLVLRVALDHVRQVAHVVDHHL